MSNTNLPGISAPEQKKESWGEFGSRHYNQQYESWMPWVEDNFLHYFTKDNKASYATKNQLSKTKITGNEQVDTLQDSVNNTVGGQLGKGGLGEGIGNMVSKEGINRSERGGKDDKGNTGPGPMSSITHPTADYAKSGGAAVVDGAKGAGGYVKGMMGGGSKGDKK